VPAAAVPEARGLPLKRGEGVPPALTLRAALRLAQPLSDAPLEGETLSCALTEAGAERVALRDPPPLPLRRGDGEVEGVPLCAALPLKSAEAEARTVGAPEREASAGEAVARGVAQPEPLTPALRVGEAAAVGEGAPDCVRCAEGERLPRALPEGAREAVRPPLGEPEGEGPGESEGDAEGEREGAPDALAEGLPEAHADAEGEGEARGEAEGDGVPLGEGLPRGLAEGEGLPPLVALPPSAPPPPLRVPLGVPSAPPLREGEPLPLAPPRLAVGVTLLLA